MYIETFNNNYYFIQLKKIDFIWNSINGIDIYNMYIYEI